MRKGARTRGGPPPLGRWTRWTGPKTLSQNGYGFGHRWTHPPTRALEGGMLPPHHSVLLCPTNIPPPFRSLTAGAWGGLGTHLGLSLAALGGLLGRHLGASWEPFGALSALLFGLLGASWGPLGLYWVPLGPSWSRLGPSWAPLGPSWSSLGPSRAPLRPSWDRIRAVLGRLRHSGAALGRYWAVLGPSWGPLGPSWAVGSQTKNGQNLKSSKSLKGDLWFWHLRALLESLLEPSWTILKQFGRLGSILGSLRGVLGPSCALSRPS